MQTEVPVEAKELRDALLRDYPHGLTVVPQRIMAEDILSLLDKGHLGRHGFIRAVTGQNFQTDIGLNVEVHVTPDGYHDLWPDLSADDVIINCRSAQGVPIAIPTQLALRGMTVEGVSLKDLMPVLLEGYRPDTDTLAEWAVLMDISRRGTAAVDDRNASQLHRLGQVAEVMDKAGSRFPGKGTARDEGLKALATEKLMRLGVRPCRPVTLRCRYCYTSGSDQVMNDRMRQRIAAFNRVWDKPATEVTPKVQHAHAAARLGDSHIIAHSTQAEGGVPVLRPVQEQYMTVSVWSTDPKYHSLVRQALAESDDALHSIEVQPYRDIRREGACSFTLQDNAGQKTLSGVVDPYMDDEVSQAMHLYKWQNLKVHPFYKEGTPLALEKPLRLDLPNWAEVKDFVEQSSPLEDYLAARKESRSLTYRVTPSGVWLYQKGYAGYAFIHPDRTVTTHGEPLSAKAMARVTQMAAQENVTVPSSLAVTAGSGLFTGQRLMFPPAPDDEWRLMLHPVDGRTVKVLQMTDVKGRPLYGADGYRADLTGWHDITGRIDKVLAYSDATGKRMFIRAEVDGVQQPAKVLTEKDRRAVLAAEVDGLTNKLANVAIRMYKTELTADRQAIRQHQGRAL